MLFSILSSHLPSSKSPPLFSPLIVGYVIDEFIEYPSDVVQRIRDKTFCFGGINTTLSELGLFICTGVLCCYYHVIRIDNIHTRKLHSDSFPPL